MINRPILALLSVLTLHISCNTRDTVDKKKETIVRSVSKTYQAPGFLNDRRIEKIGELAPKIKELFTEHLNAKKIPGIAYGVVVDDTLLITSSIGVINIEYNSPTTVNSSFRIASMTKSFTAMAILKLRNEGRLSLSDPVVKYIPEMTGLDYLTSDSPTIDIENLLTMTAGFPEDNPWGDRQLDMSNDSFINLVSKGLSLSKTPSHQYEYSNTGYSMLGYIISQVSGLPYQEYIKKKILQPLDMNHTYWEYSKVPKDHLVQGYRWEDEKWKKEPMLHDGAYGAMGGLITTIEDFSKYVSFHLSAWPSRSDEDKGPVKRSTLREMHTPQFNFLNSWNKDWNDQECASMIGYGYGLGISIDCKRITKISHGGALPGFGSNFTFYPKYGIGIMAFGNLTYTRPIPKNKIEKLLFETTAVQPRKLPTSTILEQRKEQIVQWIRTWDTDLEKKIIADNFYLDNSKQKRRKNINAILDKAGTIQKVNKVSARNQLRGDFKIQAKNGEISIFFTLSPESSPKVQHMDVSFQPGSQH